MSERLAAGAGAWIDRTEPIEFSFEGRNYRGFAGDTIASALVANDRWLISRSFKYHRPRGPLSMAGHEANTLVQLPNAPNVMADLTPITPGLAVMGQNYSGSLEHDRRRLLGAVGGFLPVGFYYRAFYRPRGAWKFWEPMVRELAGLGKVNTQSPPGYYDKQYLFADVAVVGGGPAGMAAALQAAAAGLEVVLIEENPRLGGALAYARPIDGAPAGDDLVAAIEAAADISVMTGATCTGLFADNWLAVTRGTRLYKLRAGQVIVATGSIEQPMVFRNNDLPGILLGSAAARLIRLYGIKPGARAVVVTANRDGYGVALDLAEAGVEVAAVADLRAGPPDEIEADMVRDLGIRVFRGHTVTAAGGRDRLARVVLSEITGTGECADRGTAIDCDLLCQSVGYAPAAALLCHGGARPGWDPETGMLVAPADPAPGLMAAGSVAGAYASDAVLAQGRHAGWRAVRALGGAAGPEPVVPGDLGGRGVSHPWPIFPHPKGRDFVDFDEDLQVKDIRNAVAEGYREIELVKRFSTVGMGPSQGRHSALATARLTAAATGRAVAEVGTTTYRPPARPEQFGVLAGRSFNPERLTPMHRAHLALGAKMMGAGLWWRPAFYGAAADRQALIEAEALAVRRKVGLIDVSTLGGLEVRGPDAAEFLNRMYTFTYPKQPVGRARYVLMVDRTGAVIDDGVACRLHRDHFYVTATTGGVDGVYREMTWWNAQWRLDVDVANVTAAYAGVNIAGPEARAVLAKLAEGVDLGSEAFPYMGVRLGRIAGIPCRLLRIGFVGELGYEVHGPWSMGEALWDAVLAAGAEHGIRPFGVEAQRLLRLEKGHIIVGQDTDGLTHPEEAGMAWAIARNKPFFVGGRSIEVQTKRPLGRKLVGFTIADPAAPVPKECQLVVRDGEITGRVTSAAYSPALERVIGLAYVAPDQAEVGTGFAIKLDAGRLVRANVAALPFYDPENARQAL